MQDTTLSLACALAPDYTPGLTFAKDEWTTWKRLPCLSATPAVSERRTIREHIRHCPV